MGHHLFLRGVVTAAIFLQGFEGLMIGSPQPIIAFAGNDIILPCHLEPTADVSDQTVEWSRPGTKKRFVHVRRDGKELLDTKDKSYHCRTELFVNELKNGNISLKLLKVEFSDEGVYRCSVPSLNSESLIQLLVGVVSQPNTFIVGPKDSGVDLQCESGGWYPEPEVEWLDSDGHVLSAGPTETVKGTDVGTYTVRRQVTVYQTATNRFTCRVQQRHINQTREREIHVPDGLFPVPRWKLVLWVLGGVVTLVVVAVAVLMFYIKRKRHNAEIKKAVRETETFKREKAVLESKLKDIQERLESLQKRLKELEKAKRKREAEIKRRTEQHKERMVSLVHALAIDTQIVSLVLGRGIDTQIDRVKKELEDLQRRKEQTEAEIKLRTEQHKERMEQTEAEIKRRTEQHKERMDKLKAELRAGKRQTKSGECSIL